MTMKASVNKFETLVCTALALSVVTTFAALLNAMFNVAIVA
jgi:hypothetical protein